MNLERFKILNGTQLKLFAILCMLIDHIGYMFFPGVLWLRAIGRLSMPIFAFFLSEAFIHTSNRLQFVLRLGLFALISELPYDYAFYGRVNFGNQNVMLTYFIAALALYFFEYIAGDWKEHFDVLRFISGFAAVGIMAYISYLLKTDYNYKAVLVIFIFYVLKDFAQWIRVLPGVALLVALKHNSVYKYVGLGAVPLLFYNGKKGIGLKWFFYIFYPAHLLVLYLIKRCI